MTTMREIQQEIQAFYRANGLDQLAGLLIVVVAVMAMICAHALMGITDQYGWVATILGSVFGAALFVMAIGWAIFFILAGWLFYWRNRKNAAENG